MRLKRLIAFMLAGAMAVSVALTGCGSTINADAVGATLDGEEISLGLMNFMARYQQAIGDISYLMYFGTEMWSTEISEGVTMEDSTKESVADSIETMYLLEDHMADYGVEITEDEQTAIETAAKQFMSDNSKKAIKQMGATEEYVKEMLRLYTIQQKMQDAIYEETEITVTDEEAAQRTFSYFRVSNTTTTDSDGNSVDLTDEEKETLASDMQGIAEAAKQDFDKTAEENEYDVTSYSYGSDETYMDEAVITAADALKEGEVSDLITTDEYYYVIRLDSELDEEKTAEKKESLIAQQKSDHYTEVTDAYKEEAAFEINEEAWATVKFDRLFGMRSEETDGE